MVDQIEGEARASEDEQDYMAEVISRMTDVMREAALPPGDAVEVMAFLLGRIIAFASQPGQVEANIESVKASIIRSIAIHRQHVVATSQAQPTESPTAN